MAASHHCVARSCRHASLACGSSFTPTIGRRSILGATETSFRRCFGTSRSLRSRSARRRSRSALRALPRPLPSAAARSLAPRYTLASRSVRTPSASHAQTSRLRVGSTASGSLAPLVRPSFTCLRRLLGHTASSVALASSERHDDSRPVTRALRPLSTCFIGPTFSRAVLRRSLAPCGPSRRVRPRPCFRFGLRFVADATRGVTLVAGRSLVLSTASMDALGFAAASLGPAPRRSLRSSPPRTHRSGSRLRTRTRSVSPQGATRIRRKTPTLTPGVFPRCGKPPRLRAMTAASARDYERCRFTRSPHYPIRYGLRPPEWVRSARSFPRTYSASLPSFGWNVLHSASFSAVRPTSSSLRLPLGPLTLRRISRSRRAALGSKDSGRRVPLLPTPKDRSST